MSAVLWVEDRDLFQDLLDTEEWLVVDFTAPGWCVPCQRLAPHFEKAADATLDTFVSVDVDKAPWAIDEFGVLGVPTVALFKNGKHYAPLNARTVVTLLSEITASKG